MSEMAYPGAREPSAVHAGEDLIHISDLNHTYLARTGPVYALNDIDLSIQEGEFVCVVGASGCGKTTLLQIIAGFLSPSTGTVNMGAQPIKGPSPLRGVVFQRPNLFPWLSVEENVGFGPRMRGEKRHAYAERVLSYLDMMGLADFAKQAPYELSGGMQQRVAIARALVNDPKVLLMDEPFGALDAITRERLQEELLEIWRRTKMTIFFITHSVDEAVYLGSRVLVMTPRPGRIIHERDVRLTSVGDVSPRHLRSAPEFGRIRDDLMERIYKSFSDPGP